MQRLQELTRVNCNCPLYPSIPAAKQHQALIDLSTRLLDLHCNHRNRLSKLSKAQQPATLWTEGK